MNVNIAKRLLQFLAVLHILIGLMLPWIVEWPQFGFYNQHLIAAFSTDTTEALALGKFMIGILGPTVASWGLLFLFAVNISFATRSRTGWCFMVVAITGWCLLDMYLSIRSGVWLNLLIDLIALSLLMLPLIKVRGWFFEPAAGPAGSVSISTDSVP